jgi:hypothetical protein
MRRSTAVGIAAIVAVAWAATLVLMFATGDPHANDLLRELLGLSVLAGAIAWATYRFRVRPRRESFKGQARDAGLHAGSGDPLGLLASGFSIFRRVASIRELENTAWGRWRGREVVVADYWYVPGTNTTRHDEQRFICVVDEARPGWPDLVVVPAGIGAVLRDAVGMSDLDTESERFNRAFEVRAADRRFASAMLDARMLQWLLAQAPGVGFEILGGRLMVFEPRMRSSVDDVARALERYDAFLEHVPPVVRPLAPDHVALAPSRRQDR